MSLPWLPVNAKLHTGIALINQVKRPKFKLILEHIISAQDEQVFTPEEVQKLANSLKITENDLKLLVQSVQHIYKHSSRVILKPTVLQEQLIALKFNEELAEEFVKQWTENTNQQFDLQHRKQLQNVTWELNLQSASNINNRETIPKARIALGLSGLENVTLELNQEELMRFYSTIENIQNKLDTLV